MTAQPSLFDSQREQDAKEAVLEDLSTRRKAWIARIRDDLKRTYALRRQAVVTVGHWLTAEGDREDDAWVSADDAREYLETVIAPAPEISRNFLGAVFQAPEWRRHPTRRVKSRTSGSHRNELPTWIYRP